MTKYTDKRAVTYSQTPVNIYADGTDSCVTYRIRARNDMSFWVTE